MIKKDLLQLLSLMSPQVDPLWTSESPHSFSFDPKPKNSQLLSLLLYFLHSGITWEKATSIKCRDEKSWNTGMGKDKLNLEKEREAWSW